MDDYSPYGDYFHSEGMDRTFHFPQFRYVDGNPLPQVQSQDGKWYYNPATDSQFVLYKYAQFIHGQAGKAEFVASAEALLRLQSRWCLPLSYFPSVWQSVTAARLGIGHGAGPSLECIGRALAVTKDERYREAGFRAFQLMVRPENEGGNARTLEIIDRSLAAVQVFEEVPTEIPSVILNGYLYGLIGIYDWVVLAELRSAQIIFGRHIRTVKKLLNYYDITEWTAYDLRHIPKNIPIAFAGPYHSDHIVLKHLSSYYRPNNN